MHCTHPHPVLWVETSVGPRIQVHLVLVIVKPDAPSYLVDVNFYRVAISGRAFMMDQGPEALCPRRRRRQTL